MIYYHCDCKHNQLSPLLIFVINRLFVLVRNADQYLKLGRFGLGAKLNVIQGPPPKCRLLNFHFIQKQK